MGTIESTKDKIEETQKKTYMLSRGGKPAQARKMCSGVNSLMNMQREKVERWWKMNDIRPAKEDIWNEIERIKRTSWKKLSRTRGNEWSWNSLLVIEVISVVLFTLDQFFDDKCFGFKKSKSKQRIYESKTADLTTLSSDSKSNLLQNLVSLPSKKETCKNTKSRFERDCGGCTAKEIG